ncbi:MAG: SHOCT domain-containing protein [Tyzzerella sp.]|nr:SHOCT domain-containing protein [Tyzzerella sp.]
MFVPFYSIYWTYKSAIRIDKLARTKGIQSDLSTLCLILAIFVPIIPPILMQDKVNAIVFPGTPVQQNAPVQPVTYTQQAPAQAEPEKSAVDETELLKKYKDLLDSGVITQEEFDAKKKQILGL